MLTKPGLTALLLIAFTVQSLAQPFFSREQVIADIDDLYLSIDEIHPDMFYEYPKRRFERDIRRIKQNLPERLDLAEVYNQLLPLVANLNDGHTGLSYKPDQFGITKHLYLPLKIRIDKNDYSWRVEMDLSEQDHKIPAGAHILSVNSRPAEEITANLIRYVSGEKESFKIAVLNNGLRTNQLLYIRYREPQFDIEYTFDGQRFSTTLHS
ncbi:MAG: hypothetical protein LUD68_02155, partial [Rikenellaceae bacterium]|nr:hypothetical protein [Rikenellaceae bacterium]